MNRLLNALFCLFALILAAGAHAQTSVTVQQGVSGYAGAADTYLRSRAPTTNYGSAADLLEQTNAYAPLLRFAIFQSEGGPVPNGATIQAATLSLYKSSGGATPYGAYRLLKSWSESQASWNKATSAQNWSTAGASGSGTDIAASADASASTTSAAGWLDFNVTAALTAISAGGANYGWRVLPTGGSTDLKSFRSKEYASDPTQRPKLAITYLAPNAAPTVSLTTPANGASYSAPASLTLSASAADSDGTVAKVEFFSGTTLLATLTGAPYTYAWSNVPAGSYTLSAKATDNGGAATTSTAVAVSVVPGDAATLYFVHADHLDTPRLISDAAGITVWRWDNQEPFGLNAPSEDADGNGQAFSFNPRFPGQYFDNETGTFYNLNRDYDPQTGRYVQSDPIGLRGGINTYAYVGGNPLSYTDPLGLNPGAAAGAGIGSFFGPVGTVVGGVVGFGAGAWLGWNVVGPWVSEARARGQNDPIKGLKPEKVGRDCEGRCNPCPPDFGWTVEGDGHGQTGGYTHWIRWNQDKSDPDCTCYPDRPSRGLGKD